jgi:RNA polymerase sigma-32 factor
VHTWRFLARSWGEGIVKGGIVARVAPLPVITAENGLSRYLQEIRRFPMLEPQEEFMLAKRCCEHGDREAAHRLVTSHLRLVAKIAMGYRGYGMPISEVISEGNVGLMQAVKRFEPERGFRLATYAIWWIKAAIQEYILRSWCQRAGGHRNEPSARRRRVAQCANPRGRRGHRMAGLASRRAHEPGGEFWRHSALIESLSVLNARERRIFESRRLAEESVTLEELAKEFGVSRERVRQIEVRAFEKVQNAVKLRIAAREHVPPAHYSP